MNTPNRDSNTDTFTCWAVGDPSEGFAKILCSHDEGRTWSRQGSLETIPEASLAGVAAADQEHVWSVGRREETGPVGVILRSTDGGGVWDEWRNPLTEKEILANELVAVACFDSKSLWAVGANGTILHSPNGGADWSKQKSGTQALLQGLCAVDHKTAWATGSLKGNGVILHTTDGGDTWVPQGESTIKAGVLGVCAVSDKTAWAVGSDWTVYHTANGGAHWGIQLTGPPYDINGVASHPANNAWFAADNDTFGALVGGEWKSRSLAPSGYHLLRIRALPNGTLLIAGRSNTGPSGGVLHVLEPSGAQRSYEDPVAMYGIAGAV